MPHDYSMVSVKYISCTRNKESHIQKTHLLDWFLTCWEARIRNFFAASGSFDMFISDSSAPDLIFGLPLCEARLAFRYSFSFVLEMLYLPIHIFSTV